MFKLKLKTDKWENMSPMDVAVDFGGQMYYNGFKHGMVVGAVCCAAGVITGAIIDYNKDKIKQITHDTKVKIRNKLKKS